MKKVQFSMPKISRKQQVETGILFSLVLGVLFYFFRAEAYLIGSLLGLSLTLLLPICLQPLAWGWFGLSQLLGAITQFLLLSLVFYALVFPVGMIRRLLGKDDLQLKNFKTGKHSVFTDRQESFTKRHFERSF